MDRVDLIEELVEHFVHLTGYPGSGKTTLMTRFKREFPQLDVFDSDVWMAKRYDQVAKARGRGFPATDDRQLEVDRLTAGDISRFAAKYANSSTKHGMVVGVHPHAGGRNWHKHQLSTGTVRATQRMMKRDASAGGLKSRLQGHLDMARYNRWSKQKYRAMGYHSISPRKLRKKLKSL